jgi:beta-lactamase regulating signal transducer with metallopeptidase domain
VASEILAAWLLTLALHASVLLGIAWLLDRGALRAQPAWRELLWRAAFFGGVATASVQVLLDAPSPARVTLHTTRAAVTVPTQAAASAAASARKAMPDAAKRDDKSIATMAATKATTAASFAPAAKTATKPAAFERNAIELPSWHLMLIAGWLAGALLALARLGTSFVRLERLLARAEPVEDARLRTDVAALAIQADIEAPRLAAFDDLASPIAARGRRILLPRWAIELLDREQLRAMLAHETAHIARRDPAWKFVTAVWCALFWFLPLAPLARRRLDEIAELACDAWAARHLGDGRSLAECLAECAERRVGGFDPDLAPAMASRESPLLQRIDRLLAGVPMNNQIAGVRAGVVVAMALALAAFALPGVSLRSALAQPAPSAPPAAPVPPAPPTPPKAPADKAEHHVHVSADIDLSGTKHEWTMVEVSDKDHTYRARINGKIAFTENEDGIASLSDGGTASFSETRLGKTRRVEIVSQGGKLSQRYFVDDHEQPVDAEAQQWIATLIPTVIRETAVDAEARVKRILAKGGADAVLVEIGKIDSGYARGVYLRFLAADAKLTPAQTTRALELIDGIDSDYEKRNALAAIVAAQPLDPAQQKLVLAQAAKLDSDYERAELLIGVLPKLAPEPDVRAAWLDAAAGIDSDYEHRRTLTAMLDTGNVDEATLAVVIGSAGKIDSDYERRELLVSAVQRSHDAEALAPSYASAAARIDSDYERREALLALIDAPGFGKAGAGAVLDALDGIGSDYECREVLIALARVMPNDPALIARYRDVARRLSDYERGQAEKALDRVTT